MDNTTERKYAVQFFLTEEEAAALRDYSKVESLGPAARMIVLKAIENTQISQANK